MFNPNYSRIRRPLDGPIIYFTIPFNKDNEDTFSQIEEAFEYYLSSKDFLIHFGNYYLEVCGEVSPVESFEVYYPEIKLMMVEDDDS